MGLFDWLFGDSDPDPVQSTVTQTSQVPSYIAEPHERAIAAGEQLAGIPYAPFPGPRQAQLTPDQLAGFESTRGMQGLGVAGIAPAYGAAIGATGAITPAEREQYFNPYIQDVGRRTEEEMERQHQQRLGQIAGSATQAGAFGGARHGQREAEADRNFQRSLGDMYAGVYGKGFDVAQKAAQDVRTIGQRGAATAGQLSAQAQNLGYQDVAQMLGIGQLQQQQEQRNLDVGFQDYLRQQDYPWQQLSNLSGVLTGAPYSQTLTGATTQTATQPQTGFFQQAVGLGLAGLGAGAGKGFASKLFSNSA